MVCSGCRLHGDIHPLKSGRPMREYGLVICILRYAAARRNRASDGGHANCLLERSDSLPLGPAVARGVIKPSIPVRTTDDGMLIDADSSLGMLIDCELEHIGPCVVSRDVEIILAASNFAQGRSRPSLCLLRRTTGLPGSARAGR